MYFKDFADKVVMLVRGDSLAAKMSHYLVNRIESTENIEVRFNTEVKACHGTNHLEALDVWHKTTGQTEQLSTGHLFVFLGATPRTGWLNGIVACDSRGFVLTGLLFTFFGTSPTIEIFTVVLFANTVGITTGFLALFAPGGLGVREAATSSILSTIMPLSEAIALVIVFRLWIMAWEFMGGVIAFRVLRAGFQEDPEPVRADSADAGEQ